MERPGKGDSHPQKVSGATPETTRETRVLPHFPGDFQTAGWSLQNFTDHSDACKWSLRGL
jgi:hypothetical protein